MTSRSAQLLAALLLAGCSRDAGVDVEFFSTPPISVTRLEVQLKRADGGVEERAFQNDAGIQLPATMQVLIDDARLDLTAAGFDADGQAHIGAAGTAVTPGPRNSLRVELTNAGWCPSPAPNADTVVAFGEVLATNWEQHGYAGDLSASPSACTGSQARRYVLTGANGDGQYDGFLFIAPTGIATRSISMRLRVDMAQTIRIFAKADDVQNSPTWTLPNPTACSDQNPWACTVDLVPGWQRVSVTVPGNLPPLRNFQIQFLAMGRATVDIDDLRLEPR
jgi:hypothetical protein